MKLKMNLIEQNNDSFKFQSIYLCVRADPLGIIKVYTIFYHHPKDEG